MARRHDIRICSSKRLGAVANILIAAAALSLSACASVNDLATSSTVAGYQEASLFSPVGYSVSNGPDGSIHVTASGPAGTPVDRLQKIAMARAAEYGNEEHLKAFKASPAQASFSCGKTKTYIKGERVQLRPTDYRVVEIDVTYGADLKDPAAQPTRATAETLKAQLASESVSPEVQDRKSVV